MCRRFDSYRGHMKTNNAVSQRFILLDGLRMVAALGVLSFHIVVITDYMQLDNLYVLVDFFFALSGFVLLPSMPQNIRTLPKDFGVFALKRALRFFPMVFLVISLSMGLYYLNQLQSQIQFNSFAPDPNRTQGLVWAAIFMLQIWVSQSMYMVVPLWSLSAEWFANLIFAPLTTVKWGIGIVLGIVAGYVMLQYGLTNDTDWIGNIGPIREWEALGRAMVGFGLGLFVRLYCDFFSKFRHWTLLLISVVGAYWVFQMPNDIGYDSGYFASPIFVFFILQVSKIEVSAESKWGRFLAWMGSLSFGVYAFHQVVITNIEKFMPTPNYFATDSIWAGYFIAKICAVAFISMALAWLVRQFVERKIQKGTKPMFARLALKSK
jgi:peptidoglycan/LPS O-acetylase OafA/YrhL